MSRKKLLTTLLLLCISIFTFFGCAKVEYWRAIDGNNAIVDKLIIELDKAKITAASLDYDYILNVIDADFAAFKADLEEWKKQFDLKDYPDLYERVKEGIVCENTVVGNKLTITIKYADYVMFGLFYGISNIEGYEYEKVMTDVGPFVSQMLTEDGKYQDMGFLLKKYTLLKDKGLIANLNGLDEKDDDFYRNIYTKYRELVNEEFDVEDLNITQVFVYPDDDVYTNADVEEYDSELGLKMFAWDLTGNPEDFEMEIFRLTPKAVNWYVVALIISAIVVIVLFVNFGNNARKEKLVTKKELEDDGK